MQRSTQYLLAPALPDVKNRLASAGFESAVSSPEKLASVTKARLGKMQKIVNDACISIQ